MRTFALGLALVALSACAGPAGSVGGVGATPTATPGVQSVTSTHPVTLGSRARTGTPRAVVRAARHMALEAMAPHPPVRALWVRSTWAGWSRIDGEPLAPSGENPTTAIYIVALLAHAPMTCRLCKTLTVVRGRYAYAAFQVRGRGNDDFDVTSHRPDLASLGTVRVAFTAV